MARLKRREKEYQDLDLNSLRSLLKKNKDMYVAPVDAGMTKTSGGTFLGPGGKVNTNQAYNHDRISNSSGYADQSSGDVLEGSFNLDTEDTGSAANGISANDTFGYDGSYGGTGKTKDFSFDKKSAGASKTVNLGPLTIQQIADGIGGLKNYRGINRGGEFADYLSQFAAPEIEALSNIKAILARAGLSGSPIESGAINSVAKKSNDVLLGNVNENFGITTGDEFSSVIKNLLSGGTYKIPKTYSRATGDIDPTNMVGNIIMNELKGNLGIRDMKKSASRLARDGRPNPFDMKSSLGDIFASIIGRLPKTKYQHRNRVGSVGFPNFGIGSGGFSNIGTFFNDDKDEYGGS